MNTILRRLLPPVLMLGLVPSAHADGDNVNLEFLSPPTGGLYIRWYSVVGRTYFVQVSYEPEPLARWTFAPAIESGIDDVISYELHEPDGGFPDKGFFRLKYTDQVPGPNETVDTADYDGDGICNKDEVDPPEPLAPTDPLNPDTDGDGLPDGWERAHGLNPNDSSDAANIFLGSNVSNLQAFNAGVQANPNATMDNFDGDELDNVDDADPNDGTIDWKRTAEPMFAVVELPVTNPSGLSLDDISENGTVLFTRSSEGIRIERVLVDRDLVAHPLPIVPQLLGEFGGDGPTLIDDSMLGFRILQSGSQQCTWNPLDNSYNEFQWNGYQDDIRDVRGNFRVDRTGSGLNTPQGLLANSAWSHARIERNGNIVSDNGGYWRYDPDTRSYGGRSSLTESSIESSSTLTQTEPDPQGSGEVTRTWHLIPGSTGLHVSKEDATFVKSQVALGGSRFPIGVTDQGWVATASEIWSNGSWHPLRELLSGNKPQQASLLGILDTGLGVAKVQYETGPSKMVLLVPVLTKQRIPDIADDGGETTYQYKAVPSLPWDQPVPGVEIVNKEITGNEVVLTAEIYDAISDVGDGGEALIPKLWVNSREIVPMAGDHFGIYRLQDYSYRLFPGRNEVTVAVENALGGHGHHMIVIEGDDQSGYEVVEERPNVPEHPTYPVVYEIRGKGLAEDQTITLELGGKSVAVGREGNEGDFEATVFRTKPCLSVHEPAAATSAQMANIPSDKPIFIADLNDDLNGEFQLSGSSNPVEWTTCQSGLELVSPEPVEVMATTVRNFDLQIQARGLQSSPNILAVLETYKGGVAEQDVSDDFLGAYRLAYEALPADAKNDPVSFTVEGLTVQDGFNDLTFRFDGDGLPAFFGNYQTFRFESPDRPGVRVFSADPAEEVVHDGVVGRPQDSYYSAIPDADMADFSKAIDVSGCKVVGMIDVNGCFDNAPLKRSFLVRAPPGHVFQAFDRLYQEQGREQRSQTFTPDGTDGADLASEIARIQGDGALPDSAKGALNLEIARTFQLLNAFEANVPKTHQAYIDPGDGIDQPNSWTMRGTSLPDNLASNPTPWSVTNTLSDPSRATSRAGVITINSAGENTAYYAQTAIDAPWDMTGTRAVVLCFRLVEHDTANGSDGALQLVIGDGTRIWPCQIKPSQLRVSGTTYNLPTAAFPNGLAPGQFYSLQILVPSGIDDATVRIDGETITTTATSQTGALNGIAIGDPGADIAGKVEIASLSFDNYDLAYTYGIFGADDYADSDEIDQTNNILLYLRSAGQAFRTSTIARWVKLLDPMVYEYLLHTYETRTWDGAEQELHVFTKKDIWFGDVVDVDTDKTWSGFWRPKVTKVTTTLNIDKEETRFWSRDEERNDIQLAGILMGWVHEQHDYKTWLAQRLDTDAGHIEALMLDNKHLVENIVKWAKRAEFVIETGGEILASVLNEGADWAFTIRDISQGEYMAAIGFIPCIPGSAAKTLKVLKKSDEATELIEAIHRLRDKVPGFPNGKGQWVDANNITHTVTFDNLMANADDIEAVAKARKLSTDEVLTSKGMTGKMVLETFASGNVMVFKTVEPIKVYRVYDSTKLDAVKSNYFMYEKPYSKTQVEVDYALGSLKGGVNTPFQNYDRVVEVEIPAGVYVHMGYAAKQTERYRGGATQIWLEDVLINDPAMFDWTSLGQQAELLPQF